MYRPVFPPKPSPRLENPSASSRMWFACFAYLERCSAKGPRATGIPREESLVQLLSDVTNPTDDVLDGLGHVMLGRPLQHVYRVGPQGVRENRDLRGTRRRAARLVGEYAMNTLYHQNHGEPELQFSVGRTPQTV